MRKIILLLCLSLSLKADIIKLDSEASSNLINEREMFFSEALGVAYDKVKIKRDSKDMEFIDLCQYPPSGYKFNCSTMNNEQIVGIKKYFIHTKSIQEAYETLNDSTEKLPTSNIYDYGKEASNRDDEVGNYYIWDKGRLWIIGMGYDSGSISIYQQKGDIVEVIYQWSVDW
ncbi:hypothetical protein CQA53_09890 [Helicobacter didelphidarum]|uniref:Uncharacterized protein n=1 Tax=Helicobacter didelphidarum TaxID=2040648 RepID=A0A3D8IA38_9HELI|nr:hypothetical protein [Helicobacter didelphidarum]RDU61624.1 hypothetical protein CQA53_09890 [Helicobacter didelphidarum]